MAEEKIFYPLPVVSLFIFNDQGELLLSREGRSGPKFMAIGGSIKQKETADKAAKRAAHEQANIEIDNICFIGYGEKTDYSFDPTEEKKHLIFLNFQARAIDYNGLKLAGEASEYKWLKPEDWLKEPDLPAAIGKIIKTYFLDTDNVSDKYKRALADYQNLLKRTEREKEEFARYANENLLQEILPIYSHLRLSLRHAVVADKNPWLEGVQLIAKQFQEALSAQGVEEIRAEGEKFDPATMEALAGQGEIVRQEASPGYKLRGRVIIPAKVILDK